MTYDAKESSAYGGNPTEIYEFVQSGVSHRFCNTEEALTVDGEVYSAAWPIERSEPELSDETTRSRLKITTARDFPLAIQFANGAPQQALWVTVSRVHRDDGEAVAIWQGKVRGVTWSGGQVEFECEPVEAVIGKSGLRQTYGPSCSKRLYSPRCGVSEGAWQTLATLTEVNNGGAELVAPEFDALADGFFNGGEVAIGSLGIRALIVSHVGDTLTLKYPVASAEAGQTVIAVPGCDHLWTRANGGPGHCQARFANAENFGGFPFVPPKNLYLTGAEG